MALRVPPHAIYSYSYSSCCHGISVKYIIIHDNSLQCFSSELSCRSGKGGNSSDFSMPIKLFIIINVTYLLTDYLVCAENYYIAFD